MAQIDVSNITSTSFTVRLSGLQGEYAYQRKLKWTAYNISAGYSTTFASKYTYIAAYGTNGGDYTFSDMVPNNEYQVYCTVYGVVNGTDMELTTLISEEFYTKTSGSGGDSGGGGGSSTYWTLVDKGSLGTITSQKDISFTIESYKVYRFEFQFAYSGVPKFYTTGNVATYGQWTDTSVVFSEKNGCVDPDDDITQNNGGSGNFSIGSAKYPATANTPYWLFVSGVSSSDTGPTTLHIVPPSSGEETIAKWSWTSSNGSASKEETVDAYNAVKNQQPTKNFSHDVWNDMVDKVKKLTERNPGYWLDTPYGNYNDTRMNAEPYYLTADKFNSLRNNLENVGLKLELDGIPEATDADNASEGTIPQPVESGNYVFGHYFLTLAQYINACIDKL